jgi:hypothetical protein
MNKQEMIDRLVTQSLAASTETTPEGACGRRQNRLPDFAKLPERLLKRELQFRGLLDFDEPDPFDDEADEGVSESELLVLLSGSARPSLDNHFFD